MRSSSDTEVVRSYDHQDLVTIITVELDLVVLVSCTERLDYRSVGARRQDRSIRGRDAPDGDHMVIELRLHDHNYALREAATAAPIVGDPG